MNRTTAKSARPLAALFVSVLAAALAGCAATPPPAEAQARPAPRACAELAAQRAQAEQAQRDALAQKQGAWKAVVPFVVAVHHVSATSAASDAEQALGALDAEFAKQECRRDVD